MIVTTVNSAEDHGKSLVDDGPYQEEQIPEILPTNVPDSDIAQLKHTSVCEANVIVPEIMVPASPSLCEDNRKMDAFLDEVHKKKVSDEIRQRKREKKLSEAPFAQHVNRFTVKQTSP